MYDTFHRTTYVVMKYLIEDFLISLTQNLCHSYQYHCQVNFLNRHMTFSHTHERVQQPTNIRAPYPMLQTCAIAQISN